jgi:hypothetical protein
MNAFKSSLVLLACGAPVVATAGPVMSNSDIELYGFVRLDGTCDLKGSNGDAGDWGGFIMTQPIDGSAAANKKGDTYLTARTSRLGVKGKLGDGAVSVKLEGDFNGTTAENARPGQLGTNSTGFRLRHAYLEYGGLLAGQTWSNFEDLPSLPESVQWNPPLTGVAPRQAQIRYTLGVGTGSSVSLALENSQSFTFSGNDFDRGLDLTGKFSHFANWGHMSLRGVAHRYRVDDGTTSRSATGYLLGLSGSVNLPSGRLVYGLFQGDGGGRYQWGSLLEGAIDTGTEISKFKSTAYHVGYTHIWSPNVRSNIGYATVRFDDNPNAIANLHNKSVSQAILNTFVGIAKGTELGIEYSAGRRKLMTPAIDPAANPLGRDTGVESRINVMLTAAF